MKSQLEIRFNWIGSAVTADRWRFSIVIRVVHVHIIIANNYYQNTCFKFVMQLGSSWFKIWTKQDNAFGINEFLWIVLFSHHWLYSDHFDFLLVSFSFVFLLSIICLFQASFFQVIYFLCSRNFTRRSLLNFFHCFCNFICLILRIFLYLRHFFFNIPFSYRTIFIFFWNFDDALSYTSFIKILLIASYYWTEIKQLINFSKMKFFLENWYETYCKAFWGLWSFYNSFQRAVNLIKQKTVWKVLNYIFKYVYQSIAIYKIF